MSDLGKVGKSFLKRIFDKRSVCQIRRKVLKTIPKTTKTYKKSTTTDKHYGNADELDNVRGINNQGLINEMNAFIR